MGCEIGNNGPERRSARALEAPSSTAERWKSLSLSRASTRAGPWGTVHADPGPRSTSQYKDCPIYMARRGCSAGERDRRGLSPDHSIRPPTTRPSWHPRPQILHTIAHLHTPCSPRQDNRQMGPFADWISRRSQLRFHAAVWCVREYLRSAAPPAASFVRLAGGRPGRKKHNV
jgi:hypothetical protein